MKIFTIKTDDYGSSKVNFVDKNNVVLGYETTQQCCEEADWFIADAVTRKILYNESKCTDLPGYVFDTSYFIEIDYINDPDLEGENLLYEGKMVVFRIIKGTQQKFIHLFNVHNGYYSHGFNFKNNNDLLRSDEL